MRHEIHSALAVILGSLCPVDGMAQGHLFCLEDHFSKEYVEGEVLGIEASDASLLVSNVAAAINLVSDDVTVVECSDVKKAVAYDHLTKLAGNDVIPIGRFIIYNPDWVEDVVGTDRFQAIALFGHELAHHLNNHFTNRRSIADVQKETEADRFAGCAVARLGGDWSAVEDLFDRIRRDVDLQYPNRLRSLSAAKEGFENCKERPISGAGAGEILSRVKERGFVLCGVESRELMIVPPDDLQESLNDEAKKICDAISSMVFGVKGLFRIEEVSEGSFAQFDFSSTAGGHFENVQSSEEITRLDFSEFSINYFFIAQEGSGIEFVDPLDESLTWCLSSYDRYAGERVRNLFPQLSLDDSRLEEYFGTDDARTALRSGSCDILFSDGYNATEINGGNVLSVGEFRALEPHGGRYEYVFSVPEGDAAWSVLVYNAIQALKDK